jgi:hypothetical protein
MAFHAISPARATPYPGGGVSRYGKGSNQLARYQSSLRAGAGTSRTRAAGGAATWRSARGGEIPTLIAMGQTAENAQLRGISRAEQESEFGVRRRIWKGEGHRRRVLAATSRR